LNCWPYNNSDVFIGVGAGTLSITVDGPSKVDLTCHEVDKGYEVCYNPLVPGKYFVTVKYNGKSIRGSPFSIQIDGDNLSTGMKGTRSILQSKEEHRYINVTYSSLTYEYPHIKTLLRTSRINNTNAVSILNLFHY